MRVVFLLMVTVFITSPTSSLGDHPITSQWAIAIHGGAGSDWLKLDTNEQAATKASLQQALTTGKSILAEGGNSLDAVEQVIRHLENDPIFNAGKGAVFNSAGGHELDASIMDGRDRSCGAVAGVTTVKSPISLARLVMQDTRHVLLSGDGADQFAKVKGVELVDQAYFWTQRRYDAWQRAKQQQPDDHKGTVGCVALDRNGNLAAGTSTGGLTNKLYGRVGDSPIVGAGTFADNKTCAVSCTGVGENFIRNAIAYDVSARLAYKQQPVEEAVREILTQTLDVTKNGQGGIIAVTHDAKITMQFNTGAMARAAADSSGLLVVELGE
ncbi:MAG: isoaspartyl peptidase/L-asparaginase [Planctomycetaceae bacterium]|nr:isoaspartyl peptidase/L-asparaginase [Planctomycetales bacterium]MCB9927154.1 isoaspartyl peptidase/L-asparaginase [Planctomycetaceae bacterium]